MSLSFIISKPIWFDTSHIFRKSTTSMRFYKYLIFWSCCILIYINNKVTQKKKEKKLYIWWWNALHAWRPQWILNCLLSCMHYKSEWRTKTKSKPLIPLQLFDLFRVREPGMPIPIYPYSPQPQQNLMQWSKWQPAPCIYAI